MRPFCTLVLPRYDPKNYDSKVKLYAYALPRLRDHFDTIKFTHHSDSHRDLKTKLWQELVSIAEPEPARTACPVSDFLALGPERRPCDCVTPVC